MRIAFISHPTLYDSPGGDTGQVLQTALRPKDGAAEVDILLTNDEIDYGNNDFFDFFDTTRSAEILFHIIRTKNLPSRSSPYSLTTAITTSDTGKLFREVKMAQCEYPKDLQRKIIQNYGWRETAAITMEAYKQIITA